MTRSSEREKDDVMVQYHWYFDSMKLVSRLIITLYCSINNYKVMDLLNLLKFPFSTKL